MAGFSALVWMQQCLNSGNYKLKQSWNGVIQRPTARLCLGSNTLISYCFQLVFLALCLLFWRKCWNANPKMWIWTQKISDFFWSSLCVVGGGCLKGALLLSQLKRMLTLWTDKPSLMLSHFKKTFLINAHFYQFVFNQNTMFLHILNVI